jgi:hypothetical protein
MRCFHQSNDTNLVSEVTHLEDLRVLGPGLGGHHGELV